jgi:energy-coupling factor transporter transmembrane protein EcfT
MLSAGKVPAPAKDHHMNPLKIAIGFIPQAAFVVLVNWLPLGWAAAVSLALAAVLIAVTAAHGGVKILPVVQSVVLAVFTVVGFTVGSHAATAFEPYARGAASLALGAFILATSFSFPFTVQFARQGVPQQYWKSPQFLGVNRRISLAWGLAVLAVGAGHLGAAYVGGGDPVLRLLLDWGVPVFAAYRAYSVTKRAIAQNARPRQLDGSDQPAVPSAR